MVHVLAASISLVIETSQARLLCASCVDMTTLKLRPDFFLYANCTMHTIYNLEECREGADVCDITGYITKWSVVIIGQVDWETTYSKEFISSLQVVAKSMCRPMAALNIVM